MSLEEDLPKEIIFDDNEVVNDNLDDIISKVLEIVEANLDQDTIYGISSMGITSCVHPKTYKILRKELNNIIKKQINGNYKAQASILSSKYFFKILPDNYYDVYKDYLTQEHICLNNLRQLLYVKDDYLFDLMPRLTYCGFITNAFCILQAQNIIRLCKCLTFFKDYQDNLVNEQSSPTYDRFMPKNLMLIKKMSYPTNKNS